MTQFTVDEFIPSTGNDLGPVLRWTVKIGEWRYSFSCSKAILETCDPLFLFRELGEFLKRATEDAAERAAK